MTEENKTNMKLVRGLLEKSGMDADDVRHVFSSLWTQGKIPPISDEAEYRILKDLYYRLLADISENDLHSKEAIFLDSLGAHLIEYEEGLEPEE